MFDFNVNVREHTFSEMRAKYGEKMNNFPKIYILLADRAWQKCKNSTSIGGDGGGE